VISVSRLASIVGLAGLIPFLFGLGMVLMSSAEMQSTAIQWFCVYSAGILVFLAGVYWPLGMQLERRNYPVSPVTLLILSQVFFGCAAVGLLLPTAGTLILYPLAYLGVLYVDYALLSEYWPNWYLRLRVALTTVAAGCQLITLGVLMVE